MVFLPTNSDDRRQCEQLFEQIIREEGHAVLGWRTVPTENSSLGPTAKAVQPVIRQVFIRREAGGQTKGMPLTGLDDQLAFARQLYVIRRRVENVI